MNSTLIEERRRNVFIVLAGFFLASMVWLNLIGPTRFVQLGWFSISIGVLPYPLTFICTDLISELYGKARARMLVWMGFALNLFILLLLWLIQQLPSVEPALQPPWQTLQLREPVILANGNVHTAQVEVFDILFAGTTGIVFASMAAYLVAQLCDVYLFHFLKRLTKGKHLWLRNNGSTMISQLVDTTVVIGGIYATTVIAGKMSAGRLAELIGNAYSYKLLVAALDTVLIYGLVRWLTRYLMLKNISSDPAG